MVTANKEDSLKTPAKQGSEERAPEPNKISASTPYDFSGKNLTPYGGLLPVITMLEKLGFQALVEQTLSSERIPRAMDVYRFVLGIVLGLYIGFPRLNQLRFVARDPILTGILKVNQAAGAVHLLEIRECAAWQCRPAGAAHHADPAPARLAGGQREVGSGHHRHRYHRAHAVRETDGGRKSYNPKNKGKKSYQPMLTFIAETREYVWGGLRNGDRPTGKQIRDHLRNVQAALPRV